MAVLPREKGEKNRGGVKVDYLSRYLARVATVAGWCSVLHAFVISGTVVQ